jgi:hexulose-6-phosphate isomerase
MAPLDRRALVSGAVSGAAWVALGSRSAGARAAGAKARRGRLLFAVKYGMVSGDAPMADKFRLLKSLGFDGVELDSPAGYGAQEVRAAVAASGLPVHGVVDAVHWQERLSSPEATVRRKGTDALAGALADAAGFGGHSVLLVPGRVADPENENQEQVFERSIACIREVLPRAAELGVRILIENVWNGFCYVHDGPADQTAEQLRDYIDAIASPWVGSYFDIGNHQRYGKPADWIRTLGPRIVKLDVKGWGVKQGFGKIGDDDIDWPDVRRALDEIGFSGWATAEVEGGGRAELADVRERMQRALVG